MVRIGATNQIHTNTVTEILDNLRSLIFAGYFTRRHLTGESITYYVGELVEELSYHLRKQIARALRSGGEHDGTALDHKKIIAQAEEITYAFLERIPDVRALLSTDVTAAYEGDTAALGKKEVILSYPGIYATMVNRLAHELFLLNVPLIPRMMTEHAHNLTGIDIHPGATIGSHFFIDHGTGIVIGETTSIGSYVKIYQGVTLGALSTRDRAALQGTKRHPTIEDHVTIYSGASILGGATVIGTGVVIGSNAFITKSVPEKTRVSVANPELQFKAAAGATVQSMEFTQDEFWDYVI